MSHLPNNIPNLCTLETTVTDCMDSFQPNQTKLKPKLIGKRRNMLNSNSENKYYLLSNASITLEKLVARLYLPLTASWTFHFKLELWIKNADYKEFVCECACHHTYINQADLQPKTTAYSRYIGFELFAQLCSISLLEVCIEEKKREFTQIALVAFFFFHFRLKCTAMISIPTNCIRCMQGSGMRIRHDELTFYRNRKKKCWVSWEIFLYFFFLWERKCVMGDHYSKI